MRDILVTENLVGPEIESLKGRFDVVFEPDLWRSPERLQEMISDFKAIIVRNQTEITAKMIASAPHLEVIGRAGAGLDNIDTNAATSAGITVIYTPEQNSISVAELTLGLMLALARKITAADYNTKGGEWKRQEFAGIELYGKKLGLVGIGRIGYRVGVRARAFGMDIAVYDGYANPDAIVVSELSARMMDLDELLAQADFVSCHIPLTQETRGLFDYDKFCKMKPTAFFINTSRGGVVDEAALIRALKEKEVAGAGLDVRLNEPPEKGPLCGMDNVILTPHIAAFTKEGQARVVSSVCRDVAAVLQGKEARNYFNFSKPKRMLQKGEGTMIQFLVHDKNDTVGIATVDIKAGETVEGRIMEGRGAVELKALMDVPLGHKIALKDMKVGDTVIKYGHDIGRVDADIRKGEHVHVHNLKTKRW